MSLFDRLSAIENKPYKAIYSANIPKKIPAFIEENSLKRQRPKTTSALRTTSSKSSVYSRPTTTTPESRRVSRLDKSPIKETNEDDVESVNLSLLSVESDEYTVNRHKYGRFEYFSYFERYMNRRAMVKIPLYLMPKKQGEIDENNPDPTIFELLDESEQNMIFMQYDVVAKPSRIRSNSVPLKPSHESVISRPSRKTSLSTNRLDQLTRHEDTIKAVENRLIDKENIEKEEFDVRGIKAPDEYSLGTRRVKVVETEKKEKPKKGLYSHIESKLAEYLSSNRKAPEPDIINSDQSKSALIQHDLYKKEFVVYKKKQDPDPNSERVEPTLEDCYLKMGDDLEDRIRADMKVNRGPVYFVQLTEENLNTYDETQQKKKLLMSDKYYYIYEWLKSMDENKCTHFYSNPFVLDKICSTDEDISSLQQSFRQSGEETDAVKCIGVAAKTKYKIDPFDNPTTQTFIDKLPSIKHRTRSGFMMNHDKQTFIATKDYRSMLRFDTDFSLAAVSKSKSALPSDNDLIISAKENLKKQKQLNDLLFARTQLNLFIL